MPDTASIPGLRDLWRLTRGDPGVCVAILDGPAVLDHPDLRGANLRRPPSYWLDDAVEVEDGIVDHATHVCSVVFSPHDSNVLGIAPGCRGLNVPIGVGGLGETSNFVRAIDAARDAGANIIHVAFVQPTRSGLAESMLEHAIRGCLKEGILVVSPAGNDRGECWTMPSAIPGVLAVGAMKDDGQPAQFSNFGGILGADSIGGVARQKGTSCAAPIVTGVAALLMSLQRLQGREPSAEEVRRAILESALPCDPDEVAEPERCLRGKLNIAGAMKIILGSKPIAGRTVRASGEPVETIVPVSPAAKKPIYVLGTLGYDFGTESRRDSFKQLMPPVDIEGVIVPANPYDSRQMADHLARNPSEARSLLWTLHQEQTPIYALKPVGPFGHEVYDTLRLLLAGQVDASGTDAYVERVSVPGERTDRAVRLFSGQVVPILKMRMARGLYGWQVNMLIEDAVAGAAPELAELDAVPVRRELRNLLDRIYHDLRNPGSTSKERALNYAATNAFQAAEAFARAIAERRQLKDIEVIKSPICRLHSDCWDVKLKFYDPENGGRAKRVCRLTVDVSDLLPVTLGEVRTWLTRD
jgi:hypothetical protein